MVRKTVVRKKGEAGQAVMLVVASMLFLLLGAVGMAIDGSHLWAQRQMAQAAADAAAQAGILSIFDGTNTGGNAFGSTAYNCSTSDNTTPCRLAHANGFGLTSGTNADTIRVEPDPSGVSVPGLDAGTPNLLRVTVTRPVNMTLTKFVGINTLSVSARAMAAIVDVISPVPIIITHPTMAGALNMNGTTGITITGGPQRSVQVNSNGTNPSGAAYTQPGSGNIDLTGAGPHGTGGDFGTWGGPVGTSCSAPPATCNHVKPGTTGHYLDPASWIADPLAGVAAPTPTSPATLQNRTGGQSCSILSHCIVGGVNNCPAPPPNTSSPAFTGTQPSTCQEYLPGIYSSLDLTGVSSAFFDPGIYYIEGGGFTLKNDTVWMCKTCTADTYTSHGMLIYDTCAGAQPCSFGSDSTNGFTVDTGANAELLGAGVSSFTSTASPISPFYGILFFEDRNANAHVGNGANQAHTIGAGNGCFSAVGTIYITNTRAAMLNNTAHYQQVQYHGTPCTGVANYGEIIVSQLTVNGTSGITMGLFPNGFLPVRQVALVQ